MAIGYLIYDWANKNYEYRQTKAGMIEYGTVSKLELGVLRHFPTKFDSKVQSFSDRNLKSLIQVELIKKKDDDDCVCKWSRNLVYPLICFYFSYASAKFLSKTMIPTKRVGRKDLRKLEASGRTAKWIITYSCVISKMRWWTWKLYLFCSPLYRKQFKVLHILMRDT